MPEQQRIPIGILHGSEPLNSFISQFRNNFVDYVLFPDSIQNLSQTGFFIAKHMGKKVLILCGSDEYFPKFMGEENDAGQFPVKMCQLNHENCVSLRTLFPFTEPVSRGKSRLSFGMGDRLGIATPGHIRAVKGMDVFPVLAQQSMRELNLTGRTYPTVLDDVSWAVFQEGYTGGFGADADHLKVKEHVVSAIKDGYTMITLDCSDHIDNRCFEMTFTELVQSYEKLQAEQRKECEKKYLGKELKMDDIGVKFNRETLMQCMLVYGKALDFIEDIYLDVIVKSLKKIDFEVSIDETTVPTTPEAHWFIAAELMQRNVRADNMAPRFCGEFQKGIDYIGDIKQFEKEYIIHTKIAEHFGYRLSVHSGSDKFRVFPFVGKHSGLNVHVKTAGTSWLEAVRLIAYKNPVLYRKLHVFALHGLLEAKRYYHIDADPQKIADIGMLEDGMLPALMEQNDARQVLHITYGSILQEKDAGGEYVFRNGIYQTLNEYAEDYGACLAKHMQRHLHLLGVC